MKRKLLSAALIGAMLVTSVPAFAANENTGGTSLPFTDIADGPGTMTPLPMRTTKGS